jgi:phosphoglycerol transferase MdoB-like AlkP superfamily enzyme
VSTKFIFSIYVSQLAESLEYTQILYAIFWGYKFDLAVSGVVALMVTFFDLHKKTFLYVSALALAGLFLFQMSDIMYFEDSSRHIGYEIFSALHDSKGLMATALTQHAMLVSFSLIGALVLFALIIRVGLHTHMSLSKTYALEKFFMIAITIFFVRGMFQHIPLHPWQANNVGDEKAAAIALNGAYNTLYVLANANKQVEQVTLPQIEGMQNYKEIVKEMYESESKNFAPALAVEKPNIVFVLSESWTAEYMKSYGYEHATTPFFDSLLQQSVRPKVMIANGHRTTEGIFATFASYQNPLGKSIAKSQLQDFSYNSIVKILRDKGYSSAFFQGTAKDTSGTGSLVTDLGFEQSYGKRDIKERNYEENSWGVHDGDLFNFIHATVDTKLKEPFVIGINGASTHDSVLPSGFKEQVFSDNEKINKKLNVLHYSDFALHEFMKQFESKYPNTVFVVFSDHCSGIASGVLENYMIPFLIYSKKLVQPQYYDVVMSQRDIAPTVLSLLGHNTSDVFTGRTLFGDTKFYADYFHNGTLGWIEEKQGIELDVNSDGMMTCYRLNGSYEKEAQECSNLHQSMKERALAFTQYSQELLFEGETSLFFKSFFEH